MQILNLILYNRDQVYDEMLSVQRNYLKNIKNITYFFYCYKEDINEEYKIDGDIIYIKGCETFLPGILEKTINTIAITHNYNYDYLIRSNISTIIEFNLLEKILNKNLPLYAGGNIVDLQWISFENGIFNHEHRGLLFAQGTAIILSKTAVNILLENKNKIDYGIIDDVSIAIFYKKIGFKPENYGEYYVTNTNKQVPNKIFYRNKYSDRKLDIENMDKITKQLLLGNQTFINNTPIKKCLYGQADKHIDVTELFINLFVSDNKIGIKANTIFNNYFGDPVENIVKEIYVFLEDKTITINEYVNDDIVINI